MAGRADAQAVAGLAASLGIPFFADRGDVAARSRADHLSIEDAARRARYAFLRRVAARVEAQRICVGHTADDQVETLVMHWLRGSGLRGLSGMSAVSDDIARPLLCIGHSDTLAYCRDRGWTPRQDETNDEIRFHRNRIRHELLPYLERYNPNLRQTLLRNAELLAGDEAYLSQETDRIYSKVCLEQGTSSVVFNLSALRELAPALARMAIRRAAQYLSSGKPGQWLEAKHVFQIEQLLTSGHAGAQLCLPANLVAERSRTTLELRKEPPAAHRPHVDHLAYEVLLPVPGECALPALGWRLHASLEDLPPAALDNLILGSTRPEAGSIYPVETEVYLDAGVTGSHLLVRTWRRGDRFRPLGMQNEKKLHDYFIDAGIPRDLRHQIPLVENLAHLVWVAGLRLDDRVRMTRQTKSALVIRMEPL